MDAVTSSFPKDAENGVVVSTGASACMGGSFTSQSSSTSTQVPKNMNVGSKKKEAKNKARSSNSWPSSSSSYTAVGPNYNYYNYYNYNYIPMQQQQPHYNIPRLHPPIYEYSLSPYINRGINYSYYYNTTTTTTQTFPLYPSPPPPSSSYYYYNYNYNMIPPQYPYYYPSFTPSYYYNIPTLHLPPPPPYINSYNNTMYTAPHQTLQLHSPSSSSKSSSSSFSPPPPAPLLPITNLGHFILKQIDYYFSDDNLATDIYLRKRMDEEGWVPITLIAGFRRVSQLSKDTRFILNTMRQSFTVEVKGEKLRRRGTWKKWLYTRSSQELIKQKRAESVN